MNLCMCMGMCMCSACRITSTDENPRSFLDLPQNTEIPIKERKQTDLQYFITLVLFFIFLIITIGVAAAQGDIRRLTHGYDDRGNICGYKNKPIKGIEGSGLDFTKNKFLQVTGFYNKGIRRACVNACRDGYENSIIPRCIDHRNRTKSEEFTLFMERVLFDISLCWREILVLCIFSICLSGLCVTLLRMFAKVIIWSVFIIVSLASIGLTTFAWSLVIVKAIHMNKSDDSEKEFHRRQMMNCLIAALLITTFMVAFFIMLYSVRNKMKLIFVLFEEGGKCIENMPLLLLQPVLTHFTSAVFGCLVCVGLVCFATSGEAEINVEGKVSFPSNGFFQVASWLLLFALLWLTQFFTACQNLVIAGAVSSWYFTRVKGKLNKPIWRSFCMILKYHLGSAAFGSFLIAIIKAIRFIFKMFENDARRNNQGIAVLISSIVQCLLACIETFLKILNKSAYVMIMLFGEPFCVSARRAYVCLTSDSSQVAVVIGVGTFILAVIELLITFSVTFVGAALFKNIEEIQIFWILTSIVFILSYVCCHCFFSVYDMTIDTLILCFCVDHQMNNGLERPYYMNRNLMVLFCENDRNTYEMAPIANENEGNVQVIA